MARLVAGAADRVFVTIPSWGELLKQFSPRAKPAEWLPVPCNVATDVETSAVTDMRERFAPRGGYLVGHFGTFGGHITDLLTPIVIELVRSVPDVTILLVGRGSCSYRAGVAGAHPEFAHRIHATGEVAATGVSAALRACDIAVQPYPDGISSRRTSAMAAIANGLPVVANLGVLSEPFWGDGASTRRANPQSSTHGKAGVRTAGRRLRPPRARSSSTRAVLRIVFRRQNSLTTSGSKLVTSPRRMLTVGHSYVVSLNRRLAHELSQAGRGRWDVTVAAPSFMYGDLRPIRLEHLADEACRLVPVSAYLTRYPHVMHYGAALRRLVGESWDMVHCWEEPYVFAGNRLSRWVRSARLVYYSHQNISKSYPVPFNWLERLSIRRASGWIAGGHTAEEALCQRAGYVDKPRRVISLGVDLEQFQPNGSARSAIRKSLGWSQSGPPVVGFLGRFVPEKGVGVLTAALNALATGWRALWVGGGPCEGDLRLVGSEVPG